MNNSPAVYLGRIIPKEHFRAYIYKANGDKKLVNSWDEFEAHMETGIWFAEDINAKEVQTEEAIEKPKKKSTKSTNYESQDSTYGFEVTTAHKST